MMIFAKSLNLIYVLLILSTFSVFSQYKIDSYSKKELGIPDIKAYKRTSGLIYVSLKLEGLYEREKFINFYEADSTLYYFHKDTIYDIINMFKYPVKDSSDFLYTENIADSILTFCKERNLDISPSNLNFHIDSHDRIWIYPKYVYGLYMIESNKIFRFNHDHGLPDSYIYDIAETDSGVLWFASRKGITKYVNEKFIHFKRTTVKRRRINKVNKIVPLGDQVFFITSNKKLGRVRDGEIDFINFKNKRIYDIIKGSNNYLWITFSTEQVAKIDVNGNLEFLEGTKNKRIADVYELYTDSPGTKWLFGSNYIARIPKDSGSYTTYPFPGSELRGIYETDENIWFISNELTTLYDYVDSTYHEINDAYNIHSGASKLSEVLYFGSTYNPNYNGIRVGSTASTWYYNAGLLEDKKGNKLFMQYRINKVETAVVVVDIEEIKEDPLIILYKNDNQFNLTEELKATDNRPLGAFVDSFGDFWIDTPTMIHRVSIE